MSYPLFNKERKKVAKKERNNYYCYYFSSLTLYEPIYQHIFSLILSVTFYYDATRIKKRKRLIIAKPGMR